jgi:D-xylose transport system permease protein
MPIGGWIIAGVAIAFILFMAYRNAKSVKDYGLGEANYGGELAKAAIPIVGVIAFVWMMNSYRGIPVPVIILLGVALFGAFLTNSTTFGRYLYAIGGNADAARLSGINNKMQILKVYALLGAFTGIAALIFTARVGSGAPDAGVLKELDAIAACVIGGASLMGGRGTVFGACLGALIMASLDNGMSLLNVRDFMQDIIKGSILVVAVGLDMFGRRGT